MEGSVGLHVSHCNSAQHNPSGPELRQGGARAQVHRGVYQTAQVLYARFLPLVQEHMAASPFAKVVFTGHSLGGSLGTLLMLMFLRRGVVPPVALLPAYTFGAPAVFCEGTEPGMCGLNGQARPCLHVRLCCLPRSSACSTVTLSSTPACIFDAMNTQSVFDFGLQLMELVEQG